MKRLLDLGLIEKGKGRKYLLGRKYYAAVGQKGVYTRKKGLDRETNMALLLKHIQVNTATGSKLEELSHIRLPIQALLSSELSLLSNVGVIPPTQEV